jgi:hypothetical protein
MSHRPEQSIEQQSRARIHVQRRVRRAQRLHRFRRQQTTSASATFALAACALRPALGLRFGVRFGRCFVRFGFGLLMVGAHSAADFDHSTHRLILALRARALGRPPLLLGAVL